jgi:hypothetical protein
MFCVRRWGLGLVVLGLAGLAAAPRPGQGATALSREQSSEARLKRDVTFLASPACEGRGPMTKGINLAADHIAAEFKKAGLKPGAVTVEGGFFSDFRFGTSYFQPFPLPANILEAPPTLVLKGPGDRKLTLKAGKDFSALGLSGGGKVRGGVVFAGYGITSTKPKYDDYAGLDVKGKVVVVLRDVPPSLLKGAGRTLRMQGSLTRKLGVAARNKAAAVLFVNSAEMAKGGDDLTDFNLMAVGGGGRGGRGNSLPALHIKRAVLDNLLKAAGTTLAGLEKDLAESKKPQSRELASWTADLEVKARRGSVGLKNVIGVLPGSGPLANETVVIGAHYDHLGYGSMSSLSRSTKKAIHHGADDNASGTTAVLELARRFAAMPKRQGRRLVFMTFSGEELGLNGSRYYCANPQYPLESTAAMLNLDMVGRLRQDWVVDVSLFGVSGTLKEKLLTQGSGTAKPFAGLLEKMAKKYDFHTVNQPSGFGPSDHSSFCSKKVPVLFFWTGNHRDYHRPSDTADKINVPGMRRIVDMSEEVATFMATADKPAFVEVKGGRRGFHPSRGPRLGFMPGYDEDVEGVKVEEVSEGTPAERGGIKAGDVIVAIAGKEVRNMQTYAEAMGTQKAGTTIEVVLLRKGKKVTLKVPLD